MSGSGASPRPRIFFAFVFLLWLASIEAGQLPVRFPLPPPPPPDPDLILSYVTVTAAKHVDVPRLPSQSFHIFEDGKEQKNDYFIVQSQPVSIGFLWGDGTAFDTPGPDRDERECPRTFVRNSVPLSEFFLMQSDTVTTSYTTEPTRLPLNYARSGASSDTVYIGLDVLKESANPRKFLVVITSPGGGDGGQLQREYVERVASALSSHGGQATQVHVISFVHGAENVNHEASIFLSEVVDLTGGAYNMVTVSNSICAQIAKELRVQYLIGYHSTNTAKDAKWRKLSVKVDSPSGGPKLSARIKRGYYAAKAAR